MSDATKITTGKPKIGGAIHRAPYGTLLPVDAISPLVADFKSLGYCSEDGLVNSNSMEVAEKKAWGGDTVATSQTSKKDVFKFTLIEALNLDVLKTVYGNDNVTGSLASGIVVKANSVEHGSDSYVIDMILKGGILKRITIPNATLIEVGDIIYKDDDFIGYACSIQCAPDAAGQTHYEYIIDPTIPESGLENLSIGSLELTPEFSSDVLAYTVTTENASNKITATLKSAEDTLVIKVNDVVIENESSPTWEDGENTVEVKVTGHVSGETITYTVAVTKESGE